MNRNYYGDIKGQMWSIVQLSTSPERFGCQECTPSVISYYINKEDIDCVKEEIQDILDVLGKNKEKLDKYFEINRGWNSKDLAKYLNIEESKVAFILSDYADLELGYKILKCLEEKGECAFEVEY